MRVYIHVTVSNGKFVLCYQNYINNQFYRSNVGVTKGQNSYCYSKIANSHKRLFPANLFVFLKQTKLV